MTFAVGYPIAYPLASLDGVGREPSSCRWQTIGVGSTARTVWRSACLSSSFGEWVKSAVGHLDSLAPLSGGRCTSLESADGYPVETSTSIPPTPALCTFSAPNGRKGETL